MGVVIEIMVSSRSLNKSVYGCGVSIFRDRERRTLTVSLANRNARVHVAS